MSLEKFYERCNQKVAWLDNNFGRILFLGIFLAFIFTLSACVSSNTAPTITITDPDAMNCHQARLVRDKLAAKGELLTSTGYDVAAIIGECKRGERQ